MPACIPYLTLQGLLFTVYFPVYSSYSLPSYWERTLHTCCVPIFTLQEFAQREGPVWRGPACALWLVTWDCCLTLHVGRRPCMCLPSRTFVTVNNIHTTHLGGTCPALPFLPICPMSAHSLCCIIPATTTPACLLLPALCVFSCPDLAMVGWPSLHGCLPALCPRSARLPPLPLMSSQPTTPSAPSGPPPFFTLSPDP